jgi:glutathione synthase/RimK-type ligase-like ATP-grasp enzyme
LKKITIAIHYHENSYAPKWVEYCQEHHIDYKLVNCYDSDIIEQLQTCDALMWHWGHSDYKAQLFARELIGALEANGFPVYPNAQASWYFDDKLGQKYLLESIGAPLVESYAFYDKSSAIEWVNQTTFPKVFKLRNGAGSHNVQLIKSRSQAISYINRAFGRGFQANHRGAVLADKWWHFKRDRSLESFLNISRGIYRYLIPHKKNRELPRERNYLYAQKFIENCDHDIRVFVIGDRAVTKKRFVREDDFRASGSGRMTWDIDQVPKECVEMAFEIREKLGMPSIAFDFVMDQGEPKIVEISYAASERGFPDCPGYWCRDLSWKRTPLRVEYFIIEDLLKRLE